MLVELGTNVNGGTLDSVEQHLCHAGLLDIHEMRLEHAFGGFEAFGADFDRTAVGELRWSRKKGRKRNGKGSEVQDSLRVRGRTYSVALNERGCLF